MKSKLSIELLEDNHTVSFYSPKYAGESMTEFERFLPRFKDSHPDDIAVIVYRLDKIKEDGQADRHLRFESSRRDRIMALPSYYDTANLRLYCLHIRSNILILGNGGIKSTRTYNADPILNHYVEELLKIDIEIKIKQNRKEIRINRHFLLGNLELEIERNKQNDEAE